MAGGVFNGCAVRRGDGQNTDPSTRIGSMRALQSIYTFIAHALVIYTEYFLLKTRTLTSSQHREWKQIISAGLLNFSTLISLILVSTSMI